MDIFVVSSKAYLKYLRVLMVSVYVNHPGKEVNFYVLHNELRPEDESYIREFAEGYGQATYFIPVDIEKYSALLERFQYGRWAVACMYKLFAHELLPRHLKRILYLDIDLVVNGSLTEFYHLDFDDCYFIASKTRYDVTKEPKEEFAQFDYVQNINHKTAVVGGYINSGVLLYNLDKFRSDGIDLEFYDKHLQHCYSELSLYDQSIINICFAKTTKLLTTCKYNYRILFSEQGFLEGASARDNLIKNKKTVYTHHPFEARIVHYCGPAMEFKPWELSFERQEIGSPDSHFFDMTPDCAEYISIWWKYAQLVPDYDERRNEMLLNKAAYQMIQKTLIQRQQEFCNLLGLESLYVPAWRQKNSIFLNEDLNDFIRPKVYRCVDARTKSTIKNLPKEFTEKCGFRLVVKHIAANAGEHSTPLLQILEPNAPSAAVYRRHCANPQKNAWGPWHRLATTEQIRQVGELQEKHNGELERLKAQIDDLQQKYTRELEDLKAQLDILVRNLFQASSETENVRHSLSFRIGRAITCIPRKLRDHFAKGKSE